MLGTGLGHIKGKEFVLDSVLSKGMFSFEKNELDVLFSFTL